MSKRPDTLLWPAEGRCMHCGEFHLKEIGTDSQLRLERFWDDPAPYGPKWTEGTSYTVFVCKLCGGATLVKVEHGLPSWPMTGKYQVLYPQVAAVPLGLPIAVTEAFRQVVEGAGVAPDVFPIRVRKLLEAVCDDKSATGKNLVARIAALEQLGVFSPSVRRLADSLRRFGNIAAHDSGSDITHRDARLIAEACRLLLDQVYAVDTMDAQLGARLKQLSK